MFRRKPESPSVDPLGQARSALEASLQREARLTSLAWSALQNAGRLDEAVREAHAVAAPEWRPVLAALLDLRLGTLCTLPLRGLGGEDIHTDFQAVFGYAPNLFQDPAQAATDLLELRTHTVTTFLLRLATGGPVSAELIRSQGHADLQAVIDQERASRRRPSGSVA